MIEPVDTHTAVADPWFVIWAESRAEKKVEQRMVAMGLSPWLPIVKERRKWSDRWRDVECPLFPGYLFAKATNADWHTILRTPGVLTVVKDGGKPALVADSVVESLRRVIALHEIVPEDVSEINDYRRGDEIMVQEGALCGVRGIVRQRRSGRQLVIWVAEIGRGIAVTIGTELVIPTRKPCFAPDDLIEDDPVLRVTSRQLRPALHSSPTSGPRLDQ